MYLMNIPRNFVQTGLTIPNDWQIREICMLLISYVELDWMILEGFLDLLVIQYRYIAEKILKSFIIIHKRIQSAIEVIGIYANNRNS